MNHIAVWWMIRSWWICLGNLSTNGALKPSCSTIFTGLLEMAVCYRAPLFAAVNSVATVLIVILALLSIFVAVMNMISFVLMDGENNYGGGMATLGISLEIASMEKTNTQADEVLIRADDALYRAKSAGRNRVKVTC
jgi:hypothetical protein